MNEYLVVRLNSQRTDAIQWLVWSESRHEVIASGELAGWHELDRLTEYADKRQTIVLLSAKQTILRSVDIPAGASRQFESMLPYLLEDEIAQDVEQLHFTLLAKQQGQALICALDRIWLETLLAECKALGIEIKRVLPDVLALPLNPEGLSAVEIAGQWLIRKGEYSGISVDHDWFAMLAASDWVKQEQQFLPLVAYSPLPELQLDPQQEWQQGEAELVMQLLAEQAIKSRVNLLTGPFKPKSSVWRYWSIWRKAAVAALVLLVISAASSLLQIHQYQTQADQYRAESERIFRAALPGKNKIPTVSYLKRQMDDELAKLGGGGDQNVLMNWLLKLPVTLRKVEDMNLLSVKYDGSRQELRLQAQSKDFQSFEQARVELAQYFQVDQGQLSRSGEWVNGTFVLKAK
ncbi:type II secretion system protein GspL [Vibrio sp.]|uniref:type II secretion system protein GspL n=1 Tax=Vibrio sp. TaxID=678 RepID=UPI003D12A949